MSAFGEIHRLVILHLTHVKTGPWFPAFCTGHLDLSTFILRKSWPRWSASFCFQAADSCHFLASVREIPQILHKIFLLSSPNLSHRDANCGRGVGEPVQAFLQLPLFLTARHLVQARRVQVRCKLIGQVLLFKGISTKLCPLTPASLRLAACSTSFRPKDFFPWASLVCSSGLALYRLYLARATVFNVIFLRLCLVLYWWVTALSWADLPRRGNPSRQKGHVQFLWSRGKLEVSTAR